MFNKSINTKFKLKQSNSVQENISLQADFCYEGNDNKFTTNNKETSSQVQIYLMLGNTAYQIGALIYRQQTCGFKALLR